MIAWLKKIIEKYYQSFDGTHEGYSRKKIVGTIIIIHTMLIEAFYCYKTNDFVYLPEMIVVNLGFAGALFGINSNEKIKLAKMNSENINNQSETK